MRSYGVVSRFLPAALCLVVTTAAQPQAARSQTDQLSYADFRMCMLETSLASDEDMLSRLYQRKMSSLFDECRTWVAVHERSKHSDSVDTDFDSALEEIFSINEYKCLQSGLRELRPWQKQSIIENASRLGKQAVYDIVEKERAGRGNDRFALVFNECGA